ncbi:MAG: pyridoxal-phosphate dependent enzyme, partial [Planctomycetaceae bacterium]
KDVAWSEVCCRESGLYDVYTSRGSNPYQAEGAKTIALEMTVQLPDAFDWVVVPVGGGGTLAGMWRGFLDARNLGLIDKLPKLLGVQARYYDALVPALAKGVDDEESLRHLLDGTPTVETILVKLNCRFPTDGLDALAAIRESGGTVMSFGDDEALRELARIGCCEGLFIEPSSAIVLAAIREGVSSGLIRRGQKVAAVLTGSGFRELGVLANHLKPNNVSLANKETISSLLDRVKRDHSAQ